MKPREVTMVHIYLTEGDKLLNQIMRQLHDTEKVDGVTVFRGITGFGKQGHRDRSRGRRSRMVVDHFNQTTHIVPLGGGC